MVDPPFDFTASFLTDRESSAGSAWIVIMASLDGDASKLTTALALIGARVDLVATYEDVMQLTDKSQDAPDLLYMMADEIGGLEHAIRLYRGSIGTVDLENALFSRRKRKITATRNKTRTLSR